MSPRPEPHARHHRRPTILGALALAGAALIGALGYEAFASSSQSLASSPPVVLPQRLSPSSSTGTSPAGSLGGSLGAAGGAVPDGVTVFDDGIPAVANLDPALLTALRRAATAAADDGVRFEVNSGWRSRAYQDQLFQAAVAKYGSPAAAARWVAPPDRSVHVSGDAVDIGGAGATRWLSRHGTTYGLCQIYDNEPWHYELRPDATLRGCPHRYADAAHDPRLQR